MYLYYENIIFIFILFNRGLNAQEPIIKLRQGVLIGVKIYPESSQSPIYAYLGIPYAAAPVGIKRFAPPSRHPGWNKTLLAANFGASCPHLTDIGVTNNGIKNQDENCLFLNIWTPSSSNNNINKIPVVLYLDGEDFVMPNPMHPIPGQDLASEGIVIVTANYRLNVFGFFCLGTYEARGNLAILDQYMAMIWIKENIEKFGGDPKKVTIMGHSSGAASIAYHLVSPRTKDLFSGAIIMSGSALSPWNMVKSSSEVINASKSIALSIGCFSPSSMDTLQCIRKKTVEEILRAFEKQYKNGLWTKLVLPVSDSFLNPVDQYLPSHITQSLRNGHFSNVPILIGLTSLESVEGQWLDMAQQNSSHLIKYIYTTAIPNIKEKYGFSNQDDGLTTELIKWNYIKRSEYTSDKLSLLEQLQKLFSEAKYDAPLYIQTQLIANRSKRDVFAYRFKYKEGIDATGKTMNFTGAVHGTDLPFIFGPTLLQQLARRRANQQEKRIIKRLKTYWINFIKFGNPSPNDPYNKWRSFKKDDMYIQSLGEETKVGDNDEYLYRLSFWNELLQKVSNNSTFGKMEEELCFTGDKHIIYRHTTYTLVGLLIALLILLLICTVLLKQKSREIRQHSEF